MHLIRAMENGKPGWGKGNVLFHVKQTKKNVIMRHVQQNKMTWRLDLKVGMESNLISTADDPPSLAPAAFIPVEHTEITSCCKLTQSWPPRGTVTLQVKPWRLCLLLTSLFVRLMVSAQGKQVLKSTKWLCLLNCSWCHLCLFVCFSFWKECLCPVINYNQLLFRFRAPGNYFPAQSVGKWWLVTRPSVFPFYYTRVTRVPLACERSKAQSHLYTRARPEPSWSCSVAPVARPFSPCWFYVCEHLCPCMCTVSFSFDT